MKKKSVRCPECGVRYRARALRCPACEFPNPSVKGPGVSGADRLVGISLIVIGVLIGIPIFWLLLWAPAFVSARGRLALGLLAVIPIGAIFHGILYTCGIHPKDFYAWWYSLSDLTRGLLWCLLAILVVGLLILFLFGGFSEEPDVGNFGPDVD